MSNTTPTPPADLAEVLRDLLEAVDSMQGTFSRIDGDTPEDADTHTHDGWAEGFLKERADAARSAIESNAAALAAPPVPVADDWRVKAAAWLRAKAAAQEAVNRQYPRHVESYPSWAIRVRQLLWDADELEGKPAITPTPPKEA